MVSFGCLSSVIAFSSEESSISKTGNSTGFSPSDSFVVSNGAFGPSDVAVVEGLLGECEVLWAAGFILIGHSAESIEDFILVWYVWGSNDEVGSSLKMGLSEMKRSLIIFLHGKPPAIHSQSLMSDVSDGMNMDSSPARYQVLKVETLFRVRFGLLDLVGWFIPLDLVVTGVGSSICRLVLGPSFRVCWGFVLLVFLGPTYKSVLIKEGKQIFPLNERIVQDLDFGMAMSDFLMIFPSDSSTVDFVEFNFFWPSCL